MSTPVPVPSKAALTALRGLIVGTSCTLVLLSEDRRRRINRARSAIHNAEKIRSARQYHSGSIDAALPEDEEVADQDLLAWTNRSMRKRHMWQTETWTKTSTERLMREPSLAAYTPTETAAAVTDDGGQARQATAGLQSPERSALPPAPVPPRTTKPSTTVRNLIDERSSLTFAGYDETQLARHMDSVETDLAEMANSGSLARLESAMELYFASCSALNPFTDPVRRLLNVSATLCRAFQSHGKFDTAQRILQTVLDRGPLVEKDYYAHNPLSVVSNMLDRLDFVTARRSEVVKTLRLATAFYLMRFTERPSLFGDDLCEVGLKLFETSFQVNYFVHLDAIFWRVIPLQDNAYGFTQRFMTRLREKHEYKRAIRLFLLCYSKMTPDVPSYLEVGNVIVSCAEAAHGYRANRVLRNLVQTCRRLQDGGHDVHVRLAWVARLLTCHWKQNKDLDAVKGLFQEILDADVFRTVRYPAVVYRVMIEIALEAGDVTTAEQLRAEIVQKDAGAAKDVRILGLFALSKAKSGDWSGVHESFRHMRPCGLVQKAAYAAVFVPVLKQFALDHTIGEMEEFVETYVIDLEVPLDRYVVSFMASQYSARKDADAIMSWIEYCVQAGFAFDPVLTNTILCSCRGSWRIPYRALCKLFRQIRALNPGAVDESTKRIMRQAAVLNANEGRGERDAVRRRAWRRINSSTTKANHLPVMGKCSSEPEIYDAMREAFALWQDSRVIRIYAKARQHGMAFSPRCLQVAVRARLGLDGRNFQPALDLLSKARAEGNDISDSVVPVLLAMLDCIEGGSPEQVVLAVQGMLGRFQREGVTMRSIILSHAARICLQQKHYTGTVSFTHAAAELDGHAHSCSSVYNFANLLHAYVGLGDAEGVGQVVDRMLESDYCTTKKCLHELKEARRELERQLRGQTTLDKGVLLVIDDTIGKVLDRRSEFRDEGQQLQAGVMRIMQQAAVDAEKPRVHSRAGGEAPDRKPLESRDWDVNVDHCMHEGVKAHG